jgi:hypothetical protein
MTTNVTVSIPGLHMAGSDAHYAAHFEVGAHGFALFLTPTAESPILDVNGTREQLQALVNDLQTALSARA